MGIMSMVALPSGSVFTSRLPMSLPSRYGLKITAAFMIGLPFDFFVTCTVIFEVSGGGLYFLPRRVGESCPSRLEAKAIASTMMRTIRDRQRRNNILGPFYSVAGLSWFELRVA